MLIDDRAQSQSENTGLILKAVHGTVFVGSATTGANGEGSNFVVPGGIFVGMTGVGVSHPDGTQLQRIRVSLAHALGRRRRQQRDDHRGGGREHPEPDGPSVPVLMGDTAIRKANGVAVR
jgi:hypothetical protein